MRLSVVVTVVDAGDALARCLQALATQADPPDLDVIVPWDDTVPQMDAMAAAFPTFRFPALGRVATTRPPEGAAGQHELFDRRRAAGLRAATGEVVAILEDRGVPDRDWARTMVALHGRLPHAVIGGAIENGRDRVLQWAVFVCDFNRYQRPFDAGPRPYVSDVNIGYKRGALDQTRSLWQERYHETTVHWALLRAGETLFLSPELVVRQHRDHLRFRALVAERFAWGRLFAYTRARESGPGARLARALLAPVLPAALLARHARLQWHKRVSVGRFVRAAPAVFVLLTAWSAGEAIGYLTAEP
jgi:hypothetical protein